MELFMFSGVLFNQKEKKIIGKFMEMKKIKISEINLKTEDKYFVFLVM